MYIILIKAECNFHSVVTSPRMLNVNRSHLDFLKQFNLFINDFWDVFTYNLKINYHNANILCVL